MSYEKWKKFGLSEKTEICELHIRDLIVDRGNSKYGITATKRDILEGKVSKTEGPIQVCWIQDENKFLVTDGYHRLVQSMMKSKTNFLCEIDWTGYSLKWRIPYGERRFKYRNKGDMIMKLTKQQLQKIIKEEVKKAIAEGHGFPDGALDYMGPDEGDLEKTPAYERGYQDGEEGLEPEKEFGDYYRGWLDGQKLGTGV
tara:strand:- start:41 stop:637 length:597 start_codon:yes stop_codon:yes gene_type:complete